MIGWTPQKARVWVVRYATEEAKSERRFSGLMQAAADRKCDTIEGFRQVLKDVCRWEDAGVDWAVREVEQLWSTRESHGS